MGKPIREMGLVEYIKHKRREGELDCFIANPFARSQYSILFDENEEDLAFDFAFANLMNANVGTPQDGDQGLGRARQTKQRIVYIAEAPEGTRTVRKGQGEKHLIEKFGKEADLTGAEAGKRFGGIVVCRLSNTGWLIERRGNGFSKRMSSLKAQRFTSRILKFQLSDSMSIYE